MSQRPSTKTVLIVDDDRSTRAALGAWLRGANWDVSAAGGCREALNVTMLTAPDYIITEQRLDDGSGVDLFQHIRGKRPAVAGLVLTRYPSIAGAVRAIRLGFTDYLAKPIDWKHLGELLGVVPSVDDGRASSDTTSETPLRSLARLEWEYIHSVLSCCHGNVSEAARELRVPRRSLQRKLRRLAPP